MLDFKPKTFWVALLLKTLPKLDWAGAVAAGGLATLMVVVVLVEVAGRVTWNDVSSAEVRKTVG